MIWRAPLLCLQVSKLTTVLLRACRTAAGCSSWDPLVAGCAVGKLVELEELDPQVLAGTAVRTASAVAGFGFLGPWEPLQHKVGVLLSHRFQMECSAGRGD